MTELTKHRGKPKKRTLGGNSIVVLKKVKILVATACGGRKNTNPMPAGSLYKSARIKAVCARANGRDVAILSSKYGLVNVNQIIEPYEQVMTEKRAKELIVGVAEKVKDYDHIVYFKGGARKEYLDCIEKACKLARKNLIVLGYANMGNINDLPRVLKLVGTSGGDLQT